MWFWASTLAMAGQQVTVWVDGHYVQANLTTPGTLPFVEFTGGDRPKGMIVVPWGTQVSEQRVAPPAPPPPPVAYTQPPTYGSATGRGGSTAAPAPAYAPTPAAAPAYAPAPAPAYATAYAPAPAPAYTPASTPAPTYAPAYAPAPAPAYTAPPPPAYSSAPAPAYAPAYTAAPAAAPPPAAPVASTQGNVQALELMMRTMPAEPPATCKTPSETVRQQARSQVNTGDDARMARDNVGAVRAYLAGIAMDPCNGFAWLGLGQAAIDLQRPDLAIRALRPATRLMPTHYGAWTKLGQQYEAMGQRDSAVEAYWRALELQPGLPEPKAGLGRLGAGERPAAAPSKQADTTPDFGEEEDEW